MYIKYIMNAILSRFTREKNGCRHILFLDDRGGEFLRCEKAGALFSFERLDRVEVCGFPGRKEAEADADCRAQAMEMVIQSSGKMGGRLNCRATRLPVAVPAAAPMRLLQERG